MLRYIFLAGFILLSVSTVFSQVLFEGIKEIPIHFYREVARFPQWAKSFADSTVKKVLIEQRSPFGVKPANNPVQPNLPPGVRPVDYIGRDGLPGDPLPAVMFIPSNIDFDKLRQLMIDDWKSRQPIEDKLKEKTK